jgi:molybdopterin-guanine dinucleotide biosynthesis protein A
MRRGAIVLCGGRSTRMGRDKASLPFGEETLLQRVVRILRGVVDEVIVVARPGQALPPLPAGVRRATDEVADQGPLGGLAPGLAAARAEALYVTACDVPFLAPAFVEALFDALGDADVAVAQAEGFTHPLAGVYRRGVLPRVRRLLAEGRLRPVFLHEEVRTVRVPAEALRAADPDLRSLENLNTPEAYAEALARHARAEGP